MGQVEGEDIIKKSINKRRLPKSEYVYSLFSHLNFSSYQKQDKWIRSEDEGYPLT